MVGDVGAVIGSPLAGCGATLDLTYPQVRGVTNVTKA